MKSRLRKRLLCQKAAQWEPRVERSWRTLYYLLTEKQAVLQRWRQVCRASRRRPNQIAVATRDLLKAG
ncbi:hypothetical protein D9M73_62640 [compost metagenome]